MGEHKDGGYFKLVYRDDSLWSLEACVEFEVEEGRRMVCSVAVARVAGYGRNADEICRALEKQLREDMKERAALATSGGETAEGVKAVSPHRPRELVLGSLGYALMSQIEGQPEHWRKTLDKL